MSIHLMISLTAYETMEWSDLLISHITSFHLEHLHLHSNSAACCLHSKLLHLQLHHTLQASLSMQARSEQVSSRTFQRIELTKLMGYQMVRDAQM